MWILAHSFKKNAKVHSKNICLTTALNIESMQEVLRLQLVLKIYTMIASTMFLTVHYNQNSKDYGWILKRKAMNKTQIYHYNENDKK